jgi:hypothetical protein
MAEDSCSIDISERKEEEEYRSEIGSDAKKRKHFDIQYHCCRARPPQN